MEPHNSCAVIDSPDIIALQLSNAYQAEALCVNVAVIIEASANASNEIPDPKTQLGFLRKVREQFGLAITAAERWDPSRSTNPAPYIFLKFKHPATRECSLTSLDIRRNPDAPQDHSRVSRVVRWSATGRMGGISTEFFKSK